ncbi:MAG: aromatic amino acid lyase [Polyangiaceae bacterium]|nr:aromatic amino acid lyase [Polyangiaceae bacterium]
MAGARVQHACSLRCMPQMHRASRDSLAWADDVLRTGIASRVRLVRAWRGGHPT